MALVASKALLENEVNVLPFDGQRAIEFGHINGALLRQGTTISPVDLLMASVARVHDLTLGTNNAAILRDPELAVPRWSRWSC